MNKLSLLAGAAFCLAVTGLAIYSAAADPVDEKLEIDGVEMITKAPAPS